MTSDERTELVNWMKTNGVLHLKENFSGLDGICRPIEILLGVGHLPQPAKTKAEIALGVERAKRHSPTNEEIQYAHTEGLPNDV
jgi:hypothetical protein